MPLSRRKFPLCATFWNISPVALDWTPLHWSKFPKKKFSNSEELFRDRDTFWHRLQFCPKIHITFKRYDIFKLILKFRDLFILNIPKKPPENYFIPPKNPQYQKNVYPLWQCLIPRFRDESEMLAALGQTVHALLSLSHTQTLKGFCESLISSYYEISKSSFSDNARQFAFSRH